MKRFCNTATWISIILLLGSCQTVEQVSIDYLVPSVISFPSQLKKVAIVNNMSDTPDNAIKPLDKDSINKWIKPLVMKTDNYQGDPVVTSQSLAEAIANENYFDLVVICDSALRANDITPRENALSRTEVGELSLKLNVDMLIALENVQIQSTTSIFPVPEWNGFRSAVDAKVTPTIRIYLPNRSTPLVTINKSDNIFWEDFESTLARAQTKVINKEQLIEEASEFAGTIPISQMLPSWKTDIRYYFAGGAVEMRDAAVYVRQNNWDKAFELWNNYYNTAKNNKKRMYAASNIALYYEMKDDLTKAEEWGQKALALRTKPETTTVAADKSGNILVYDNFSAIFFNLNEIAKRKENFAKLNVQMERFNE